MKNIILASVLTLFAAGAVYAQPAATAPAAVTHHEGKRRVIRKARWHKKVMKRKAHKAMKHHMMKKHIKRHVK